MRELIALVHDEATQSAELSRVLHGLGEDVAECETYRPSTWARRQRDSDRRQRDSEAPGVQLTDLSDARRRAA